MFVFLLVLILLGTVACGPSESAPPTEEVASEESRTRAVLAQIDPKPWVRAYDPKIAANGYNLAFYERRIPVIMDMNGNLVHAWPEARFKSRIRLLPDGAILGILRGHGVAEYDWHGEQRWSYRVHDGMPHHDVIPLANGNVLFPVLPKGSGWDVLREVNREREVVWEWRAEEHLEVAAEDMVSKGDVTHINSVQELPENRWFENGDPRFRPGNLLVSVRNLNLLIIIERSTGNVVWRFDQRLDRQHEALMIEDRGHPAVGERAGNILVLSNGYLGTYGYRQSSILEIRPDDNTIVWEYSPPGFYTRTGGVQQPLPNGNVLITSDHGRRVFEVNRDERLAWQWAPPFRPTRPRRYAYDHCPQLAARGKPDEVAVVPGEGYLHVDPPIYRFAFKGARRDAKINGKKRNVLKENNLCRRILLPAAATVELAFGLDEEKRSQTESVRFALRLQPDGGEEEVLFQHEIGPADAAEHQEAVDLGAFAYRWTRLCVATSAVDLTAAFWASPAISSTEQAADTQTLAEDLTPAEIEARKEHLRTLGYVD